MFIHLYPNGNRYNMPTSLNTLGPEINMPVVCMDDRSRPNDIPISKWPVRGSKYTVINRVRMINQGNTYGVLLKEISLEGCYPWRFYAESRFAIDVAAFAKMHSEKEIGTELDKENVEGGVLEAA